MNISKLYKMSMLGILGLCFSVFFSGVVFANPKYMGVKKCKMCHKKAKMGNQFGQWEASEHAKAFEILASDEAKELAKTKDIDNPQESDSCLKCHTTGFRVPAVQLHKKFDKALGVQCESCHGPGEKHIKAMLKKKPISAEQFTQKPDEALCKTCHNEESPSFKDFDFAAQQKEISHPKP